MRNTPFPLMRPVTRVALPTTLVSWGCRVIGVGRKANTTATDLKQRSPIFVGFCSARRASGEDFA